MITLRPSHERGHFDFGWLDTHHTFSFGDYYDPQHMGFGALRVINEDYVNPGQGFHPHSHQDMEIFTFVLDGALSHKDSMGNGSTITPGEVQRMSAGTGVTHSEFNHSQTQAVHLLQIWILPEKKGLSPSYEQKNYLSRLEKNIPCLLASPNGEKDSVRLNQNAQIYLLKGDTKVEMPLNPAFKTWVQLTHGEASIEDKKIVAGDGVAIEGEAKIIFSGKNYQGLIFQIP